MTALHQHENQICTPIPLEPSNPSEPETLSLKTFLELFGEQLLERSSALYPPLVNTAQLEPLDHFKRAPIGGQRKALAGLKVGLETYRSVFLVAEMGTGKSYLSIVASEITAFHRIKRLKRTLIICPPHLTEKWAREIASTCDQAVTIIESPRDLHDIEQRSGFFILSREKMKLGSGWRAAVNKRRWKKGFTLTCPNCGVDLMVNGLNATLEGLNKKKRSCSSCKSPLWQVDNLGPRRIALADYITDRLPKGTFDLLILDEGHEFKNGSSAQSNAATKLGEHCTKTLLLTGTLFGGYASTLFHLMWRFHRSIRDRYAIDDEARFIEDYGLVEKITIHEHEEDGRTSSRTNNRVSSKERPGINPKVLCDLLKSTVFLRLSDLGEILPKYEENILEIEMDPDQAQIHLQFARELTNEVAKGLARGDQRVLGKAMMPLLHNPDTPWVPECITLEHQNGSLQILASSQSLPAERIYPKEAALVQYIQNRKAAGRKVLVYIQGTERRDITRRLQGLLELNGIRTMVLKSDTVSAKQREAYVFKHQHSIDALICHPRIVQTGLDLLAFTSLVYYQTEYSTFTVRQSSRRSWRIGQTEDIEVTFFAYKQTVQTRALRLIAAKAQKSLALEGELVETGLTNLAEEDPLIALARSLVLNTTEQASFAPPRDWAPKFLRDAIEDTPQHLTPMNVTGVYMLEREVKQHHAKKNSVAVGDLMLFPMEEMNLESA